MQNVAADERREALGRILESVTLANCRRLRQFLAYVGHAALEGQADTIKEQIIAVEIFGKAADYRPAEDNIVRVTARQLRTKIEEYYATEGAADPWRIQIPRGTYVPDFVPAGTETNRRASTGEVIPRSAGWRWQSSGWIAATLVTLLWVLTLMTDRHPQRSGSDLTVLRLMQPNTTQSILLVCADASVQMEKSVTERSLSLAEYQQQQPVPGDSAQAQAAFRWIDNARLIGIGNAGAVAELIPAFSPGSVLVRHPRQVSERDFMDSNIILLSGPFANPWVQLFEPKLNFQVVEDSFGRAYVRNVKLQSGEQAEYHPVGQDGMNLAFTRIAFLPSLSGRGKVLLIGGPSSTSTELMARKLADPAFYQELAGKLGVRASQPMPYFEVLLEVSEMGRAPSSVRILAVRRR